MAMEPRRSAMELVRAALGRYREITTSSLTVLCLVVRGENLQFANGVRINRDLRGAIAAIVDVCNAIDCDLCLSCTGSVDLETSQATFVRLLAVKGADNARNDLQVIEDHASIHAEIIQLFAGDHAGALAGFRLQLQFTRSRFHRYGCIGGTHLQNKRSNAESITRSQNHLGL